MRKLIIGCGYLGRRVATMWQSQGDDVWCLTRSPERAAEWKGAGLHPIVGDVMALDTLAGLPEVDTVLYAVGLDRQSGLTQREVYVDGLANVISILRDRVGRFIYISSSSVYGQSAGEWIDEESVCEPNRANGLVCLEAEGLVRSAFPEHRPEIPGGSNVLRLSGIYGPKRLLSRVETLRTGEPLGGNPDAWLNLIHVDDATRVVLACEQHAAPGRTYLVSDDEPIRRRTYYAALAALVEAPEPRFQTLEPSAPDATSLNKRCRNARLHQELQVKLTYPTIKDGLPQALNSK